MLSVLSTCYMAPLPIDMASRACVSQRSNTQNKRLPTFMCNVPENGGAQVHGKSNVCATAGKPQPRAQAPHCSGVA